MNRNFGVGILIVCFGLSSVNIGLAAEVVAVPPVIVQPYDLQTLNQQMLERDRQNRDEEIAIKRIIEENDELIQTTLSGQQREGLQKVNQIMLHYRDALLSRDQARIAANGEKRWSSRYGDLVVLTEDADAMTVHRDLENKSGLLAEKYQMLTALKDEMMALNEKLKGPGGPQEYTLNLKDVGLEGLKKIVQQQQDKIKMLVERLGEMDQKIAHFDEILAQKDQQIALLKDKLAQALSSRPSENQNIKSKPAEGVQLSPIVVQPYGDVKPVGNSLNDQIQRQADELKLKDEAIHWLKGQMSSQQLQMPMQQLREEVRKVKDDFALRSKDFNQYESSIVSLKDRLGLAGQLINLQQQEAALLVEKSRLALQQYTIFDGRLARFEKKFKALLANHTEELQNALGQKQQQVDSLKEQLEEKITNQKNQAQLEAQMQDLKTQLQDRQDQIAKLKAQIQENVGTESLKGQLAAERDKVVLLKEELENKIVESHKVTQLVDDYQKKLEAKDNAYNEQLRQISETKEDMDQLRKHAVNKDKMIQAKDLSLSMMQQMMDEKIKEMKDLGEELALDRQRLQGMPNSDELDFLKSGLQKATKELAAKDQGFQSIRDQLQDTQLQLAKSKEDVEYKTKEILRLKYLSKMTGPDLQKEVAILTQKLAAAEKKLQSKTHGNQVAALEAQLKVSAQRIKELEAQVNEFKLQTKSDAVDVKLQQALNKIDEQGRLISVLSQKLEDIQGHTGAPSKDQNTEKQ